MKLKLYLLMVSVLFITGCAHKIQIQPDTIQLDPVNNSQKIQATAGYYISPELKNKEVITPGGGGDRVRYNPYKDLEGGFQKVLKNSFVNVKELSSNQAMYTSQQNVDYIISLDIETNSSSASMFTWPPTWFGVSLNTEIFNTKTKKIERISVKGEGTATYSTFIFNKGKSGQNASLQALQKLQTSLIESDYFKKSTKTISDPNIEIIPKQKTNSSSIESRLEKLKDLHTKGLINSTEYQTKKGEILNGI